MLLKDFADFLVNARFDAQLIQRHLGDDLADVVGLFELNETCGAEPLQNLFGHIGHVFTRQVHLGQAP